MAENNTTGAVHLTELSLDLTQFNENIRQIEQATAQVADVSVQNLSKIRDALNIPTDQITFKVDTSGITQNVDRAKESVERFGNTMRSVSTEIKGGQLFTFDTASLDSLVSQLGLTGDSATVARTKLGKLFNEIESYSKIQISTSGGELFRAVVTSSGEAGESIQKVIDLTKELGDIDTEATIRITDNAEKRNAEIERANANFVKQLNSINSDYEKLANTINRTDLSNITKQGFIDSIEKAKEKIESLKEKISSMNQVVPTEYLSTLDDLMAKLKEVEIDFGNTSEAQKKLANDAKEVVTTLRGLERATTFQTQKNDISDLRLSYQELISQLKSGDISLDDAKSKFAELGIQFQSLQGKINPNSIAIANFVIKIEDLTLKYANLISAIKNSKVSEDTGMKQVVADAVEAESALKTMTEGLSSGLLNIREASGSFDEINHKLTRLRTQFIDTGNAQKELLESADLAQKLAGKYDTLQQSLSRFATQLSSQNIKMQSPEMDKLVEQAKNLESQAVRSAQELKNMGVASKEAERDFDRFGQEVKGLHTSFNNLQQSSNAYKQALAPIQQQAQETATALKALEKSAQFKTQKQEIANLRAEYENFINRLKTAGMSAEEAKSQLADLDVRFQSLQGSVYRSNTVLGRFAARLGETIKWRIAHSAITLLMQSFGNLTSTIIKTEDAVIELRRVLGDTAGLSNAAMADALYDIAYQYGRTFQNVQEVAVKFAQAGMDWNEVIDATKATMLGLNTAELDVSTATEGLIAVMAQFNIEASDLETVIDKINITADNFPVTSEKIVDALQRAGGTASAFGMSLEETIGVITALSEATGRAGTAIGTALNSLISFSMKDTALEKFSQFLGKDVSNYGVVQLWRELSDAIKGGNTELATMMAQSEEFSSLMDESLATAIGLGEEYTLALKEQNQTLADGKDIYSTVGTYRQNYFIALLNNIDTAVQAIYGMRDAVGYSMRENETAMEAFSKKWNQFIISAQELAIQFANSGFLDMMKVIVEIADSFLKITKNVGGLNTVLAITFALLYQIKKAQFHKMIANISDTFSTLRQAINVYNTAVSLSYTKTEALTMAMATFEITAAGVTGIIGLLVTGVGWLIQKNKEAEEAAAQARAESIRAGDEAVKSLESTMQSYVAYKNTLDDTTATIDEVNDARENMMELLGIEKDENGKLVKSNGEIIDSYEELDSIIRQLTEDEYALAKAKAQQALEDAKTNIAKSDTALHAWDIGAAGSSLFRSSQSDVYWDMLRKNKDLLKEIQEILYSKPTPDNISEQVKKLSEALIYLQKNYDDATLVSDKLYQSIVRQLETYKALEAELNNAQGDVNSLAEDFEHYVDAIDAASDSTDEFAITAEKLAEDIESISDIMETLNGKVDEFQSAYQTLISIIDEYNETGIMTADMLQSLLELEPEYIELLDIKGDSISIDDERLQNLIATNDDYLNQLVALKAAEEADALMKDAQAAAALGLTLQEYQLMDATDNLNLKTYALVKQFYDGELSAGAFRTELANLAEQAGITGSNLQYLVDSMSDVVNMYGALYTASSGTQQAIARANTEAGNIKRYYTPSSSSRKSSGGSSSSKQEDPFKAQKEALDEMLDAYEHAVKLIEFDNEKIFDSDKLKANAEEIVAIYKQMQAEVHEMADRYRAADSDKYADEIRKLQDKWLDYRDKIAKAISDIDNLLDAQEHSILLMEIESRKMVDPEKQRSYAKKTVDIYKQMQNEVHERAEMLRELGYKEESEQIRKLQSLWWSYQQEIEKIMQEVFDDIVGTYENAVNYLQHLYNQADDNLDYSYMRDNLKKQMEYYVKIQEEAANQLKYLAEKGYDIASDEAQAIVDVFYDAGQKIKEIARQIAADILDPFDDFIDLADKFDIWEYMDFTKVDYLRDKLTALNKLFEEGTITAKQYNEELKSLSYAIYDAQRELFQKQQDEIEKAAQETIKAYNEQIKLLNKQKDSINDYYDDLIDGYNKEIEAWEKRKEEVSDYYDTLIDNLRDVEKANERINKQVDYYNERQKIITNLEQAQARSGVEWREKEIEYQQNLIDLDEDWRRTLEEWSIEDQIAALENLKETTLKDIELSIQAIRDTITAAQEAKQAALDAIDAEIQGIQEMIETVEKETEEAVAAIEEQIKDMSRTIAESIKNGVEDGLVDSKEELDKALVDGTNALLGFIDSNGKAMEEGVREASANSYALYTAEFLEPYSDSVTEIASGMKDALAVGATEGAKEALSAFKTGFIEPLKSELSSLMSQINSAKANIASAASSGSASSSAKTSASSGSSSKTTSTTGAGTTSSVPSFKDFYEANTPSNWEKIRDFPKNFGTTNVFITNNNNSIESAANRTAQTLRNILG